VVLYLYFFWSDNALYDALLIDDECGAERAHIGASCHLLFTPNTKLFDELFVCVRDEWERKIILFNKALVRLLTIDAYSHYFVALASQFAVVIAQIASFRSAARGGVFWIEIKNEFFCLKNRSNESRYRLSLCLISRVLCCLFP